MPTRRSRNGFGAQASTWRSSSFLWSSPEGWTLQVPNSVSETCGEGVCKQVLDRELPALGSRRTGPCPAPLGLSQQEDKGRCPAGSARRVAGPGT